MTSLSSSSSSLSYSTAPTSKHSSLAQSPLSQKRTPSLKDSTKKSEVKEDEGQIQRLSRLEIGVKIEDCRDNSKKTIIIKHLEMKDFVGFSSLPSQLARRIIQTPFEFNLLVVGGSGLGKSTLINSMFLTDIHAQKKDEKKIRKTVTIETRKVEAKENDISLNLSVTDTPGFGDAIDNTNCCDVIVDYVEKQFKLNMENETAIERGKHADSLVHACLYFISPSGHGLKRIDVEFMRRLAGRVNIIPVIGKADVLTKTELEAFRQMIMLQIKECNISLYEFTNSSVNKSLPLALVGSNTILQNADGSRERARRYPWGTVLVENKNHSDFTVLREALISEDMLNLKNITSSVLYERFRTQQLSQQLNMIDDKTRGCTEKNPIAALKDEEIEHRNKMVKMEEEMEEIFKKKVKERTWKLEATELELEQAIVTEKQSLAEAREDLYFRKEDFDREKEAFESKQSNKDKESAQSLGRSINFGFNFGPLKIGKL